jgi:hypothetical protein
MIWGSKISQRACLGTKIRQMRSRFRETGSFQAPPIKPSRCGRKTKPNEAWGAGLDWLGLVCQDQVWPLLTADFRGRTASTSSFKIAFESGALFAWKKSIE